MPVTIIDGPTIAAGESLSDALDCTNGALVRLTMPSGWTPANLSFQISPDNIAPYSDLFDYQGHELMMAVTPGITVLFPPDFMAGIPFIKFRSGSRTRPIPQQAQRKFSTSINK